MTQWAADVHLAFGASRAKRPRLPLAPYAYTYITLLLLAVESRMPHVLLSVVFKVNDFARSQRRA